jgi:ferric-dicitrate binding protein FerR (iron transport regulator)
MKREYIYFTAVDFAKNVEFLKWIKYPDENPEIKNAWEHWLMQHPAKKEDVDEAKELIYAVLEQRYIPGDVKQREVWNRINETLDQDSGIVAGTTRTLWQPWFSRAASVILITVTAIAGWKIYMWPEQERTATVAHTEDLIVQENKNSVARTITFEDGTSVILQPNSSIKYPRAFKNDLREVYLTGEGFFEVRRDPARPFIVHANELVTRVLGTSFSIRNFNEEDVLVRVKTGKVSVFKEKDQLSQRKEDTLEGVVLTANQQVVYARDQMKLTKSLVENPAVLVPLAKHDFEFTDTPIKEVFQIIEDAYGVDIVYDEEALSTCYLNASLSDVPLYDKLKLICQGISATYEMMDSHIIIYGKGCSE